MFLALYIAQPRFLAPATLLYFVTETLKISNGLVFEILV